MLHIVTEDMVKAFNHYVGSMFDVFQIREAKRAVAMHNDPHQVHRTLSSIGGALEKEKKKNNNLVDTSYNPKKYD